MLTLIVFVPESHKELLKQAMFEAGAGKYDHYDQCSFEVKGVGQFRPLDGANPAIGEQDQLESVNEWRVEFLVKKEKIKAVIKGLVATHPYETPAYYLYEHFIV
jgi:structural toxin protein (hemagglutinin/hemolysin) RtxA